MATAPTKKIKKPHHRRSYSCGPCKHHKTKCDHNVPCYSCQRYRREHLCLQNPATPPVPKQPRIKRLRIIESTPAKIAGKQQAAKHSPFGPPTPLGLSSLASQAPSSANNSITTSPTYIRHVSNAQQFNAPPTHSTLLKPISESNDLEPKESVKPLPHRSIPEPNTNTDQSFTHPSIAHGNPQKHLPTSSTPNNPSQGSSSSNIPPQNNPPNPVLIAPGTGQYNFSTPSTIPPQHTAIPPSNFIHQPHPSRYAEALGQSASLPSPIASSPYSLQQSNESSHLSTAITTISAPFYATTPDAQTSFRINSSGMQDKDDQIQVLKSRIDELEELVSKLSGIASFSYVNTSAAAAENSDSVIAGQGPIYDVWNMTSSELNWRFVLLRALPSREHCKVYVSYYFEHVDYIYHPLHNMSFLEELDAFWTKDSNSVDIIWVSILFMIISLSSLHLPKEIAKRLEVNDSIFSLSQSSALWFRASRQALQAGGYDEKPTFQQLQTFSLAQLYLYATNQTELLNSLLSQAIRHAQVLGLHSDIPGSNCIETELRRRIWWDICGCDTFQSLCMGRPTLVNSYVSTVPFPLNCHEADMTPTRIISQPRVVPTIMSFQIERNVVMKILNRLYNDVNGSHPSYEEVLKTDREIHDYILKMPWFFCVGGNGKLAGGRMLGSDLEYIHFQAHMLHTCLCMHRVRIYQPFLQNNAQLSWNACLSSVKSMFAIYSQLRVHFGGVGGNYNFITQIHQAFSGAVAQGMFLLVEKPGEEDAAVLSRDVEMFVDDLHTLMKSFFVTIPILTDGINTISRIREMVSKGSSAEKSSKVVSGVYSVFGGKKTTETYLKRCTIDYLVNSAASTDSSDLPYQSQAGSSNQNGSQFGNDDQMNGLPNNITLDQLPPDPNSLVVNYYNTAAYQNMWNFPSQNLMEESLKHHNQQVVNGNSAAGFKRVDLLRWDAFDNLI